MAWVLFRVDAGAAIGSGHWMRCLTLADRLHEEGYDCVFISAQQLPGLVERTLARGHHHYPLAPVAMDEADDRQPRYSHSRWLATDEIQDAQRVETCLAGLRQRLGANPSWIVVDHYALAAPWEERFTPTAPVLAIDDLHDRPHQARWVLDQTAGKTPDVYDGRMLNADGELLLGADYALLRPEFIRCRPASLARRTQPRPGADRLLLTLGGVDADNISLWVLQALLPLQSSLDVEVVVGAAYPHWDELQHWCDAHWPSCRRYRQVDDMAERMVAADLCIGAAGSTSWERCCLGLPTVQLQLADNQRHIAHYLDKVGAALNFGLPASGRETELAEWVQDVMQHPQRLQHLSQQAAALCDGTGVERVVARLKAGAWQ
ncbi:UDP-2,4-diacetamido-2,4,6-trideoxy-beta-L-altropyranose hydrolase [Saccharospirillum sp. MSK14-1]|uniref:UDP-2,4-diacetamido-2,4, 6-trideoxy-beta-L-altropyranose hydrolase n=1 Tax=Saccharospirillum sp. MSK14-1 TaxID=1897632 RepID=UPI000D36071D|nr:UDP-2,4-diacetamido-2,4,6-trideoxy-beta-L-altropyranose hydrolase [Saccharospirillum sp. MSK14-1]PTY36777.1 UDP-2,4-diacetamido-2,4,6-trideoxy-beta-L-altropyranose hydrolase [Saccharospirillum sp. MSK14-1]